MNLHKQENRSMSIECPKGKVKPMEDPCRAGVHVIVWLFSLRPPAELYPMAVSKGTPNPPEQLNV